MQVIPAIDVRGGRVAVNGWTQTTGLAAVDVARRFEDAGISALIVTDIDHDGAMLGFRVEVFAAIAGAVGIPVIAAGGLASIDDIERLCRDSAAPIAGAVLGRALYEGRIRPAEALALAARC